MRDEEDHFYDQIAVRVKDPRFRVVAGGMIDLYQDVFRDEDRALYEAVLPKLSERGFLVIDNVLWRGEVLAASSDDPDTSALIALNDMIRDDPRVRRVLLPVRDGVTLVRKVA